MSEIEMKHIHCYCLAAVVALLLMGCKHDEPASPYKPLDQRRVLVLSTSGEIYDHSGKKIKQLPNCTFAAEIIADGDDYFVSGVESRGRVGYWKNGKWNTLHVDFIEDVDHWTYGIGKWDYYIFLLDIPNVLKNSGIFPLENCHDFIPATHALRVSEGKCYVIGNGFDENDEKAHYKPVLYTNYKKEFLPMPDGVVSGECRAIYAYDRDHTILGGVIGRQPAVWIDKQYQIYETSTHQYLDGYTPLGSIEAVTRNADHIYAAGWELTESGDNCATVWIDGSRVHYLSPEADGTSSRAVDIYAYDNDIYLLTCEYNKVIDKDIFYLWLNGNIIMSYYDIQAIGFTVL